MPRFLPPVACRRALVGGLAGCLLSAAAVAQTVFVCENDGRSFVGVSGANNANCRPVADPERDLHLSTAQPDLDAVVRELSRQSARIDRLEQMLLGARVSPPRRAPLARPSPDRFDTQDRMRDLGQDIERRLDELSR